MVKASGQITITDLHDGPKGDTGATGPQGPVGENAVMGILSNETHTVPTDSAGNNGNYTGANSTMSIYVGATDDSINWSVTVTVSNVTGSLSGKTYTVTGLSADSGYVEFTATRSGYSNVVKRFTLSKNKQGVTGDTGPTGANATAYWLVANAPAIAKSSTGSLTPSSITVTGKSQTGTNAPVDYAGRFIIAEQDSAGTWADKYTSTADESVKTYTPSVNTILAIRVRFHLAGGTTVLLDEQTIALVVDGAKGDTGATGPKGDTGATGPTGPQGVQGSPAISYTWTLANVSVDSQGNLRKSGGTTAWDGQAYTKESFVGGSFVGFKLAKSSIFMFGLNSDPSANASYTSIDYAYYIHTDGYVRIYENGTGIGTFGMFAVGDSFYIVYDGATVKYYRNGNLDRTVSTTSGRTFWVDSSFYDIHSTNQITDIFFGPAGTVGATGPKGDTGATGPTGPTGPDGLDMNVGFSTNPYFKHYSSSVPDGYSAWYTGPTKETAITKRGNNAVRWNLGSGVAGGMSSSGTGQAVGKTPELDYLVLEFDVYIVSATSLKGAGVIVDFDGYVTNSDGTITQVYKRVNVDLSAEVTSWKTGAWYQVRKFIVNPKGYGTFEYMRIYLMANWSGFNGTQDAKDIIYDYVDLRQATEQEVLAYQTKGNIQNAVTTIDNNGVNVKDGSFTIEDSITGYRSRVDTKTNLLSDHSFEMLEINGGQNLNGLYNVLTNADIWFRWGTVGTPLLKSQLGSDVDMDVSFGNQAVNVNSTNYVKQAFRVIPNRTYTLSFYSKYSNMNTADTDVGQPRAFIRFYGDGVLVAEKYVDFPKPPYAINQDRRYMIENVGAPNALSNYVDIWGEVLLLTPNAYWVEYDGIQMVQSSKAHNYEPENELWSMRRGVDKYNVVNGGKGKLDSLGVPSLDMGVGQYSALTHVGAIAFDWTTTGTYGSTQDSANYHGIVSKTTNGGWADVLRINSYSHVIVDIDSNNNSTSEFMIVRHGTGTNINEKLFYVDEGGNFGTSGWDFRLGQLETARGNTGGSRALVKNSGGTLYINYANDFYGGTVVNSNLTVTGQLVAQGNGGNTFDMVGSDHTYIEWYPQGTANGRKSYFGFASANTSSFTWYNAGNIDINSYSGRIQLHTYSGSGKYIVVNRSGVNSAGTANEPAILPTAHHYGSSGLSNYAWYRSFAASHVNTSLGKYKRNIQVQDKKVSKDLLRSIEFKNYVYDKDIDAVERYDIDTKQKIDYTKMGMIVEEVKHIPNSQLILDEEMSGVDLYSYATLIATTVQDMLDEIDLLRSELETLKKGVGNNGTT